MKISFECFSLKEILHQNKLLYVKVSRHNNLSNYFALIRFMYSDLKYIAI